MAQFVRKVWVPAMTLMWGLILGVWTATLFGLDGAPPVGRPAEPLGVSRGDCAMHGAMPWEVGDDD